MSDATSWWSDYKKAFLKGINPVAGIGESLNLDFPEPHTNAPPLPDRWWRNDVEHPLFPQKQQGVPTEAPATPLSGGQTSIDNFRGTVPLKLLNRAPRSQ